MNIEPRHLSLVEDFQARHRAGLMTLVFTDLAGSTKLKSQLGDAVAGAILGRHHTCVRELLKGFPAAREVSTAGDSFFLVFDSPSNAVLFSLRLHKRLRELSQEVGYSIRDRVGIHVGEVFIEHGETEGRVQNFTGIHVDTCARVMGVCEPERTLLTRFAFENAQQTLTGRKEGMGRLLWMCHGLYELKGVAQPLEICEVWEKGKTRPKAPPDTDKAKKFLGESTMPLSGETALEHAEGWRGVVARRRREVLLSVAVAWAAVLVVIFSPYLLSKMDGISFDFATLFKAPVVPAQAVIVFMDEKSHQELGSGQAPDNAPWDHALHARLVDRLTKSRAKAIVFDVLFERKQPRSDLLVKACANAGNVFIPILEKGPRTDTWMVTPFDELRSVTSGGVVESFSQTQTARKQYGVRGDVQIKSMAELVAERMAPGQSAKAKGRWLNYYGPSKTIRNVSYVQALSPNDIPDEIFRDKAVFIGAISFEGYTGGRGTNDYIRAYDEFPTPFGKAPGVELNATACLNLTRGDAWEKISPYAELTIFLGVAVLLAILFSFMATGWAVIASVALAFALAFGSSWLVWKTNQWFCWALISVVEIPAILLCSVSTRTDKLSRQKKELEDTLVAQRSEFLTKASLLQTQSGHQVSVEGNNGKPQIPDHELFSPIGKGAYGEVWIGIDLTNSFRAVKIVRAKNFGSDRPFDREFEGIKRFAPISRAHPGLVDVLHLGINEDEGWFFYIMEAADDIVSGREIDPGRYRPKTLLSMLEGNQALRPGEFLSMAIQLCEALEFLHGKGLLHRDIKPANVLYVGGRPQLADPGLVAGARTDVSEITMIGTLGYMAPDGAASAASDIYSLGKVLYQAGYGRPVAAFPELPTFLINPENQAFLMGLNDIILKACAPDARERHASAGELRRELEELGREAGILKGGAVKVEGAG